MIEDTTTATGQKTIEIIPISIDRDKAASLIKPYSANYLVQIQKLVYYPYLWVLFKYHVKTILGKSRTIDASTLVDLINNRGATTERFETEEQTVNADNILEADYSSSEGLKTAKSYLTHAAIHKMKALLVPDYEIVSKKIIYKPFWIAKCTNRERESFKVIIDSQTGKFQVL